MITFPKDPVILLSYVNTQLRDHYSSLDALCEDADLSKDEVISKLRMINYDYDAQKNAFV